MPFNPHIHGARGLFAMLVFVFHVANSGLPTFAAVSGSLFERFLLGSFKFGVELFFGISGYVIVGALGRTPSLRAFAWDRATRIYPVLWLTLCAITAFSLLQGGWLPPRGQWLLNFTAPPPFLEIGQLNPAAWSLGYELTYYAIAGVCWQLKRMGKPIWRPFAVILGVTLILMFPRAILIPAGILIALGWADNPIVRRASRFPLLLLVSFLLVWRWIDLASGSVQTLDPVHSDFADWLLFIPAIAAAGLIGGLALCGLARGDGPIGRLTASAPVRWLGTISYSFYLWHPLVMAFVKVLMHRLGLVDRAGAFAQTTFAMLSLPPALLIAAVSQRVIELRFTRWLRRHGPAEDRHQAPITARADSAADRDAMPLSRRPT